jgi:hypothetical protein
VSNQTYRSRHSRDFQLWIYLLPVIGVIPAIWTLYRAENQPKTSFSEVSDSSIRLKQQHKASRLSLNLALVWVSSYSLLFLGAANVSGIGSFRLLYINAIVTTGYFLACTILMFRLTKNSPTDNF